MERDQIQTSVVGTQRRQALKDLSLRDFLHFECGFSYEKIDAYDFKFRVGTPSTGDRGWVEVNHAITGNTVKFFFSASSNHSVETLKERGLNLRLQLLPPNGESARTESAWYTANEGNTTEMTAAALFGKAGDPVM